MISPSLLDQLHQTLVDEIRSRRPEYLTAPFTVAEIYQDLVPYRTHRDRIGAAMNGDYEHALLRLLAGEGEYLVLDSDAARRRIQDELGSSNPNTGLFREYAAVDVRLNPARLTARPPAAREEDAGSPAAAEPLPGDDAGHGPAAEEAPPEGAADEVGPGDAASEPGAPPEPAAHRAEEPARSAPERAAAAAPGPQAGEPGTCRWCREELPRRDNLRYCPFCGTDVNLVPCPSCSEELEPEWRFCIACGTEVAPE